MKLIVIVGITGKQGGSVARRFLNEPGWKIRGITRDTSKASSLAWKEAGVEAVKADLDDVGSLEQAFSDANVVFGVTNFWELVQTAETRRIAKEKGILMNQAAYQRELQQAKNLIDAVAKTGSTLEKFIWSSLSDTKKWSNGNITFNYHFDAKADATKYLQSIYPELANLTCYLQVGFYMTNAIGGFFAPKKQPDGNFLVRIPCAAKPLPLPWVQTANDTGHYVYALVRAPAGTTILGHSTKADVFEFCDMFTRVLRQRGLIREDQTCQFDGSMTVEEANRAIPGGIGRELGESAMYSSTYGFDGGDPQVLNPADIGVEMDKLTSLEEYLRTEDWKDIL